MYSDPEARPELEANARQHYIYIYDTVHNLL